MGKGSKWSQHEDAQLARSWVCTSEDPIKGTDQSKDKFWSTIHEHWSSALGQDDRTIQALKNRWSIVSRSAQKFIGYVAQAKSRRASGNTDEDVMQAALALFLSLEHEVFQQVAAWRTLSACPKWQVLPTAKSSAIKKAVEDEDQVTSEETCDEDTRRPMGTKQAKRKSLEHVDMTKKLDELVQAQNNKNKLFSDYMLMQMLTASSEPDDLQALNQLKSDYMAKRFRSCEN
ncbi:hypothetical protein DYB28_005322 [Aphanomyces astaci]|uniref:No apical meristem-associated C-terminal domain-containing protein n=1 Tax=Aphanomyces astaci TaxID=112090 RepID=A0A9X8H960_APHAT|nr:hypothetical protein DYB28_005322 [Aphanomyces astaci]